MGITDNVPCQNATKAWNIFYRILRTVWFLSSTCNENTWVRPGQEYLFFKTNDTKKALSNMYIFCDWLSKMYYVLTENLTKIFGLAETHRDVFFRSKCQSHFFKLTVLTQLRSVSGDWVAGATGLSKAEQ